MFIKFNIYFKKMSERIVGILLARNVLNILKTNNLEYQIFSFLSSSIVIS